MSESKRDVLYIGCKALAKRVFDDERKWRTINHLLTTSSAIFRARKCGSRWSSYEFWISGMGATGTATEVLITSSNGNNHCRSMTASVIIPFGSNT